MQILKKKANLILVIIFIFFSKVTFSQYREPRGRYYDSDHVGLPPFEFAGKAFLIGAFLILAALGISKISEKSGVLVGPMFFIGILCIFPLIGWIQAVLGSIFFTLAIIAVIFVGVVLIWQFLFPKDKQK